MLSSSQCFLRQVNQSALTVHVGVLFFIFILILTPSVPEQDLSLFGCSLGGGLSHLPGLPAHLLILVTLICPEEHTPFRSITQQRVCNKLNRTKSNNRGKGNGTNRNPFSSSVTFYWTSPLFHPSSPSSLFWHQNHFHHLHPPPLPPQSRCLRRYQNHLRRTKKIIIILS